MYKSFLIAGCLLVVACQFQNNSKNNSATALVNPGSGASAIQAESAKLLNQYLQLKTLVASISDTSQLRKLAIVMKQSADSVTTLSSNFPEPISDSVAGASMALSDELSGLSIETDLHEIQMAFQVASLQLFELLKWCKLSGVTIYKYYDVEGISGKGASWLDISRNSLQPYDIQSDPKNESKKLLIIDSLMQ